MIYHWMHDTKRDEYVVYYFVDRDKGKVVIVYVTRDVTKAQEVCAAMNSKSNGKLN